LIRLLRQTHISCISGLILEPVKLASQKKWEKEGDIKMLKAKVSRSVLIPLDLAEKLAERAHQEGKSNAQIIIDALEYYLLKENNDKNQAK